MANIFDSLTTFGTHWTVAESRNFTAQEIGAIASNVVEPYQYGLSVKFFKKSGGYNSIPLSNHCTAEAGSSIDMTKAKLLRLSRPGDSDIYRVEI